MKLLIRLIKHLYAPGGWVGCDNRVVDNGLKFLSSFLTEPNGVKEILDESTNPES